MVSVLSVACAAGLSERHLVAVNERHKLMSEAANAFSRLQARARAAGFDLAIASSWRGYERQLAIFNGKAEGQRTVHNDVGEPLERDRYSADRWLDCILRFSALPGASRHHWGTDLDVYDQAALSPGDSLALSPGEYAADGCQGMFSAWLAERVAADDAEGFCLPYRQDCGGVAPEPWHLSYRPLAVRCEGLVTPELLLQHWRGEGVSASLALLEQVEARLDELWARFVVINPGA